MKPTSINKGEMKMCEHHKHHHGHGHGGCCAGTEHHRSHGQSGCCRGHECDCDEHRGRGHSRLHRRYQTKDEMIAELQAYLEDLEAEVMAVKERVADLQA
jgi:hypothetical protein